MAILSDYEEVDQKKPTSSESSSTKPFSAGLDPSDPLGFLERVFEFVARESDLFKSDSLVTDVNAVVRMVKDKVTTEEKKRKQKDVKIDANGKVEKKIKEEPPAAVVKKEKDEEKKESDLKADEEKGPRAPNKANGLDMDHYSWGQNLQEVNITVPVPPGTKSRFIACEIKKNHLKVGIKGQLAFIDGELFQLSRSMTAFGV